MTSPMNMNGNGGQERMQIALAGWVRTAVVPRHGAFRYHQPHTLAAPLVQHLLAQAGLPARAVDALFLGNALGAGGNPARLTALAAGLPERCMALTVDTQCCAGLDAINLGAAQILAGQADVVIAGGSEAWSRSPIRHHRPLHPGETPHAYERPAFTPWPDRDPDLLQAAADHAARHGWTRAQQEAWAQRSHGQALRHARHIGAAGSREPCASGPILALDGIGHDPAPRHLTPRHLQRMPVLRVPAPKTGPPRPPETAAATHAEHAEHATQATQTTQAAPAARVRQATQDGKLQDGKPQDPHALSMVAVSPQADGAALVLLASERACRRYGLCPRAHWVAGQSLGTRPTDPLTGALAATQALLARQNVLPRQLHAVELHDAFAVQGLAFARAMQRRGMSTSRINAWGGGLARGHPIGASGAVALVQLLARLASRSPAGSMPEGKDIPPAGPDGSTHRRNPDFLLPGPAELHPDGHAASRSQASGSRLGLACIAGAGGLGSAALISYRPEH